jgi:hypothetical protein
LERGQWQAAVTEDSSNSNNNNKYNIKTVHVECKKKEMLERTEATGTTPKSLSKYLSNILGKREIKELQNTALLGTAHILRKVLSTYKTFKWKTALHVS